MSQCFKHMFVINDRILFHISYIRLIFTGTAHFRYLLLATAVLFANHMAMSLEKIPDLSADYRIHVSGSCFTTRVILGRSLYGLSAP